MGGGGGWYGFSLSGKMSSESSALRLQYKEISSPHYSAVMLDSLTS